MRYSICRAHLREMAHQVAEMSTDSLRYTLWHYIHPGTGNTEYPPIDDRQALCRLACRVVINELHKRGQ